MNHSTDCYGPIQSVIREYSFKLSMIDIYPLTWNDPMLIRNRKWKSKRKFSIKEKYRDIMLLTADILPVSSNEK